MSSQLNPQEVAQIDVDEPDMPDRLRAAHSLLRRAAQNTPSDTPPHDLLHRTLERCLSPK